MFPLPTARRKFPSLKRRLYSSSAHSATNAGGEPLPEAGAPWLLEAVSCTRWFGQALASCAPAPGVPHHAYWITSSARTRRDGGIVIPRALAVLRLMTSWNVVGCSTGRSAGLVPFRILSTYVAARRQ